MFLCQQLTSHIKFNTLTMHIVSKEELVIANGGEHVYYIPGYFVVWVVCNRGLCSIKHYFIVLHFNSGLNCFDSFLFIFFVNILIVYNFYIEIY